MRTLSIGKLVYDINILMDGFPAEGNKYVTKELVNCSGGSANIVAFALGKWNADSYVSGVIGYDETGTAMKKDMEDNRVKTNYLETNYDIKTPVSYIIRNKQNNTHTTISAEISDYNIKKYDYDMAMDCVIADGSEYNASVTAFNKFNNGTTILNAKTPQKELLDFFKYAKYVVCTGEVAEAMTGLKIDFGTPISMTNVYKAIINKYPNVKLIITVEEKGTIYAVDNEIKVLMSIPTEIVDKTGSRDIFTAMVGYGISSGYDLDVTIRLATIAESMSKKAFGATLAIPTLSDIINFYESKFGKLVNPLEVPAEFTYEEAKKTPNNVPELAEVPTENQNNDQNAPTA